MKSRPATATVIGTVPARKTRGRVEANVMRIASTTIRVAKMKTCDEKVAGDACAGAIVMPINAKAASAKPLPSSILMKWRRHWPTLTSERGMESRRRHWSSM